MWWVKENSDHSRGGFQNRDIGRTNFGRDFGPDFGIDFALFAAEPDVKVDMLLKQEIDQTLLPKYSNLVRDLSVVVRNGFVILKGETSDEEVKSKITQQIFLIPSVKEVINQILYVRD